MVWAQENKSRGLVLILPLLGLGPAPSCRVEGWVLCALEPELEVLSGSIVSSTHFSDRDFETQRGTVTLQM